MLKNPPHQIGGNPDVKRAANPAGLDVDPVVSFNTHQNFTTFAASSTFADDAIEPGTTHP
jgi:hypothetical protein